jgi:hypothetical protein
VGGGRQQDLVRRKRKLLVFGLTFLFKEVEQLDEELDKERRMLSV